MKKKEFVSYEEAAEWARNNKIFSQKDWHNNKAIRPKNIPSQPHVTYKDSGWKGYALFFTRRLKT